MGCSLANSERITPLVICEQVEAHSEGLIYAALGVSRDLPSDRTVPVGYLERSQQALSRRTLKTTNY
jgi:hypothetical protein